MERRTLEQLAAVDERVTRFGPLGLMTDRRLTDRATLEHLQDQVVDLDLPDGVPEAVREHFDALRILHVYGAFQPEFFGMVVTQASLTLEHALGARFIEAHDGLVPVQRTKTKQSEVVETDDFAAMAERFVAGWRLDGHPWFNGSLASLLRWAHRAGLLRRWLSEVWGPREGSIKFAELTRFDEGRRIPPSWEAWDDAHRTAWWEETFRPMWEQEHLDIERGLRNLLAHRTSRFLTTGPDSAQALRSLATMITSLWDPASIATP